MRIPWKEGSEESSVSEEQYQERFWRRRLDEIKQELINFERTSTLPFTAILTAVRAVAYCDKIHTTSSFPICSAQHKYYSNAVYAAALPSAWYLRCAEPAADGPGRMWTPGGRWEGSA